MPRKPTDPRPDRRYAPRSIDMRLDPFRSASAVVGVPGLSVLPGNLAAMFADAVRELRNEAGGHQAQSQAPAPSAGDPIPPDATIQAHGTRGGYMTNPAVALETGDIASSSNTATPTSTIALNTSDEGILRWRPAASFGGGGGAALPGRGGSGGLSSQNQASGPAPRLSGQSGSSSSFTSGFYPTPPATATLGQAQTRAAASNPATDGAAAQTAAGAPAQPTDPTQSNLPVASSSLPANPTQPNPANQPEAPNTSLQASSTAANGLSALAGLAGNSSATNSFGIGGGSDSLTTLGSFALDTSSLAPSSSSSSSSSQTTSLTSSPISSQGGGSAGATASGLAGAAAMLAPVGGGDGGIFAQAYRYQQSPPDSAPYSSGPVSDNPAAAPFNTLNSLILSYIDSALSNIVAANTGGTNIATTPTLWSFSSTDGLGLYTFSASANDNVDGQYVAGSFSTTDNATLVYSFKEVGYTPDGNQFTLSDTGGATLNVSADDGNSTTHFLTNTLAGSDSYALIQVLSQSDATAGSYTSAESSTESVGGSDSFTLSGTQTETVDGSGNITSGSDTYTYSESGNDTSSLSDIGNDSADDGSGITEADGGSSTGGGSGGYTMYATGADAMTTGGFLPSGSNHFTWGGSDSESVTTTDSDSDTDDDGGGDDENDWSNDGDTDSESESNGETGSQNYTDTEGTDFGWTETVGYTANNTGNGSDQGTETDGETDADSDGGDTDQDGETYSTTETDQGTAPVSSTLVVTGTQALTGGVITGGSDTFTWHSTVSDSETDTETDTASESDSDSGMYVDSGDTTSYSDGETDTDNETTTETDTPYTGFCWSESDSGVETMGSYGLVSGGGASDLMNAETGVLDTITATAEDTSTETEADTDDTDGDTDIDQLCDVETDQDTQSAQNLDYVFGASAISQALGAGGLVVGYSESDSSSTEGGATDSETDTDSDHGTETDSMPGEHDTDSYSDADTDSLTVYGSPQDYAIDVELGTVTIGTGGAVTGGDESTSIDDDTDDVSNTIGTAAENAADSSTESSSEGDDTSSDSLSTTESDTDSSTEIEIDYLLTTETASLSLGSAGVVLAGNGYELEAEPGFWDRLFGESDTDTGGSTENEVDVDTDDVGGNTTSDRICTSETDTDSTSTSDGGTDYSSSTLNDSYGPGGLVTGGTETDGEATTESTTVTVNDSSSDSSTQSETDSDLEGADDSTDTITDTENDQDSDNETNTDSGSSGDDETIVLGAAMDELNGTESDWQSDTATDAGTNIDTATTTTNESDSYSATVGAETTTDGDDDESTDTDTTTDTDHDGPTNTEESAESFGVAGLVLSGSSTDTVDDTGTLGESDDDVDTDTPSETLSDDDDGDSDNGSDDEDTTTDTDSETETGSDSAPYTLTEVTSQVLGLDGVIIGGGIASIESSGDSGSWDTTGSDNDTATDVDSGDEEDTGDDEDESDSSQESGSFTPSGGSDDGSAEYESTTETLGDGGAIIGGSVTESTSESSGSTQTSTETDGESDRFSDTSSDVEGLDNDTGSDAGTDTVTETDTTDSTLIETVNEDLGVDGTVADGDESDSLDESTGDTTTEVAQPVETVTDSDSASDVTMTLTETNTTTDTDDEADEDWACEALGTSAVIAGGSDCFTVDTLDDSTYVSCGSGPEDYTDTSGSLTGTAIVNGSGSSSNQVDQTFGDTLRRGGAIASGSMSFTVDGSNSDAQTKTEENGTETIADELSYGPSQTASNTIDTTTGDDDTADETGTETLGAGGTISSGSASVSWSEGDSIQRDLTINGIDTDLSINEDSTDTYGFAESGTETITAGGADAPSTLSFDWDQMGTDDYNIDQQNTGSIPTDGIWGTDSYSLTLVDTVSSSWSDTGEDELGDGDSLTEQSDTYTWNELNSLTDSMAYLEAYYLSDGIQTVTEDLAEPADGIASVSLADTGSETLSVGETGPLTLDAETDCFTVQEFSSDQDNIAYNFNLSFYSSLYGTGAGSGSYEGADTEYLSETGDHWQSGSLSTASDTYASQDYQFASASSYVSDSAYESIGDSGGQGAGSYSIGVVGADSFGPGCATQATMGYSALASYTGEVDGYLSEYGTSRSVDGVNSLYATDGGTWTDSDGYQSDSDFASASPYSSTIGIGVYEGGAESLVEDGALGGLICDIESDQLTGIDGADYSDFVGSNSDFDELPPELGISTPEGAVALLGQPAPSFGLAPFADDFLDQEILSFEPGTNTSTANGLPGQEAAALLGNLAENPVSPDGVSSDAPPSPTATLVALAAAGRNPTDVTIPTQGGEGTGTGSSSGSGSGSGSSGGSGSGDGGDFVRASGVMVSQGAVTLPGSAGGATAGSGSNGSGNGTADAADALAASATSGTNPSSASGASSAASATTVTYAGAAPALADSRASEMVEADDDPPAQGSNLTPQPGGYVGGGFNPLNWRRLALTGNANAPDEYYQAADETAGAAIGQRAVPAMQAVGGTLEVSAGATMVATGVGTVPGAVLIAHGADTAIAGARGLAAGEAKETFTKQVVTNATGSDTAGRIVDAGIPLVAGGFGIAAQKLAARKAAVKVTTDLVDAEAATGGPAIGEAATSAAGNAAGELATKPGEAVFWSGRTAGVGGADVAADVAASQGGTTLEQLAEARGIKLPVWDASNPASVEAWQNASRAFAQNAKGTVTAVIGDNLRPGNVWETVELPALMANPNVTQIVRVDPATGARIVIFTR